MKLRSRLLAVVSAGMAVLASGCAQMEQPREWGRCAVLGALGGAAVGTGIGFAIADNVNGDNGQTKPRIITGTLIGTGVGAVVGLVAGHYCPTGNPAASATTSPPPSTATTPPTSSGEGKAVLRGVHCSANTASGPAMPRSSMKPQHTASEKYPVHVNGYCDDRKRGLQSAAVATLQSSRLSRTCGIGGASYRASQDRFVAPSTVVARKTSVNLVPSNNVEAVAQAPAYAGARSSYR